MTEWPEALIELINELSRLPGIGERTATRLALHVVNSGSEFPASLAGALVGVSERLGKCERCGNLAEDALCNVCSDPRRDEQQICVVQGYSDVVAVNRTGEFPGVFHVLHGLIRPLDGIGPEDLRLDRLFDRVRTQDAREVIIATSPSVEGEATAMYIRNALSNENVRVSRIARGLPMGSEVEYADRATLGRALSAREDL